MLRKIKLYGELANFIGHKEFEVKVGNYEIGEDELTYPIGKKEDIHFIPVITGAGRGFGKILLGAALIGVAILSPGAGFMAGGGFGFAGAGAMAGKFSFAAMLGNIGIGLVLTGVSEMLTPLPKKHEFSSEEDPRLSFSFGGTQQTGRAGTPVPLVYGEIFTGSVVISGGIDTEQVQA